MTFHLPPYPYDRLDGLAKLAEAHPRAWSTAPSARRTTAPLPAVVEALASSGTERGYPASAGSPQLRQAAADWLDRRFGLDGLSPASVAACVGTKELVASVPHVLRLRQPDRDTVLYPAVSYPTYAMGAELAGLPRRGGPGRAGTGRWSRPRGDRSRATPGAPSCCGPTRPRTRPAGSAISGPRRPGAGTRGIPVFSDECYAEFTWDGPPRSVLEHGTDGVVAVHSLSKRSNLAGVRVGFYAGDAELVEFLRAVRQHAGLMVPGPAQAAGVAALADDAHVVRQRERYLERLRYLAEVLTAYGCPAPLPEGGFYLWVPVPAGRWTDAWAMAEALARHGGVLVSPGDLYGDDGAGHVRIAVVQPMERLALVGARLAAASGVSA